MKALNELRVVEIGGDISSAYAGKLLADLGADVVKIESPTGDPLRHWGPFAGPEPDPEAGGLFGYLNANKRSVAVDLDRPAAVSSLQTLFAGCDIVIESGPPGGLAARGLGPDVLVPPSRPGALVQISPFGQTGPYRDLPATDLVVQAAAGWVSAHGLPGAPAVRVGGRIPEYLVASFAATAALTAVRAARDQGQRVEVDVSVMECLVATLPYPMLWAETLKKMGMPPPQKRRTPLPGVLHCRDGWVGVNVLTAQQWADVCTLFEVPRFVEEQKNIQSDLPIAGEFFAAIQPWLDAHDADEIVTLGQAFRIPTVWIGNGSTLERFEQFRERPFMIEQPEANWRRPGAPYRLSRTPATVRSPAPTLGADTATLEAPWAPRSSEASAVGEARPKGRQDAKALPMRDLRVLDLGTFWAGPFVGMYLASQGADVIKVESVQRPDGFRFSQTYPELGDDYYEHSTTYQGSNHGKRDLTLDLRQEEARALLLRLVAATDVMIENFSPRVMDNFGLTYDALKKVKPDLILVRMPGFGTEGPWRDYVGWATVIEQASGMSWVTGHPAGPPLSPGGFIDCGVSMHAGVALQAALYHRARTGEGQQIEVAQLETGVCLTAEQVIAHSMTGETLERQGNRDREMAPQGAYLCEDGTWVALSVRDDTDWANLVDLLGRPAWALDPTLEHFAGRRDRQDQLDQGLSDWMKQRSATEVVEILRGAGLPAAAALVATRMYGEPHLEARGFYQTLEHPRSGERRFPVWPMRFSYGPQRVYAAPAPTLGQHNAEILGGELGLGQEDLARLQKASIIGDKMAR